MSQTATQRRRVPAGLVDAALASGATFLMGLFAIGAFDRSTLGFYALFMAAFGLSTAISTNVAYVPGEKVVLGLVTDRRSLAVRRSVGAGLPAALAGGVVMIIPALVVAARGAEPAVVQGLAISAGLTAVISPIQDHLRRLLHLAGRSWNAVATSAIQAAGVVAGLSLLSAASVDPAWVAFGALGIANVVSSAFAVRAASRLGESGSLTESEMEMLASELRMARLSRSGRWLASTGIVSTGNNLLVSSIILALAGEVALGYAEAARTIAQPVLVAAVGLRAVLGPDSMAAARDRNRAAAAATSKTFWTVLGVGAVVYAMVAGFPWDFSPLMSLADKAYVIPGLVLVTIVANIANGGAFPSRLELIGADRESSLFRSELWSNAAQLVVGSGIAAIGGSWLGPAARPLSMAALGSVRLGLYRRPLAVHYRRDAHPVEVNT